MTATSRPALWRRVLSPILDLLTAFGGAGYAIAAATGSVTTSGFELNGRPAVLLLAASGFGVATHLLSTSVLGARTRTLPTWVVVVGVVAALGFLGSAVTGVVSAGGEADIVGAVGFGLWCVWILAVSAVMWRELGVHGAVGAA